MSADGKAPRAGLYQRISKDRAGDEHGVDNQRADQLRIAAARGYDIVLDYSDNDISAYTGKHRPGFRAILDAARRGEIDVILVFQTSRFWRNRRERAEAIEILSKARVSIIATKGPSLDLSTAYGRAMAGLLGVFAIALYQAFGVTAAIRRAHLADRGQLTPGLLAAAAAGASAPAITAAAMAAAALLPFIVIGDTAGNELLHTAAAVILAGLIVAVLLNTLVLPVAWLRFGPVRAPEPDRGTGQDQDLAELPGVPRPRQAPEVPAAPQPAGQPEHPVR